MSVPEKKSSKGKHDRACDVWENSRDSRAACGNKEAKLGRARGMDVMQQNNDDFPSRDG